ncbi:MAG: PP2C family protein-serine/threonine phosphatase [Micromonosporaceae bacterium]
MVGTGQAGAEERLRRLETLTAAALSELDTDELLGEMLDRVRQVLSVDTAAILLLDKLTQRLIATAARGLEEEVQQGFTIEVGAGFAGRVAIERQPVIIDHVTPDVVVNPILLDKGLRSLLGVPMLNRGELVGVLHVGTLEPRVFTAEDVELLQLVADRTALASQARLNRLDRSAALALQRSLLPVRPPVLPGLDLAARYVPGHDAGVGGDWYDVFSLPSGWLGLVVGDVSGHGLRAAVVMGRLRSALRAYALECDDPADALTRLDRKISHFETGNLATALYAMITPDLRQLNISLAGHLPPVVAVPGEPARMLALPVDLPLGTGSAAPRRCTTVPLENGSTLLFYTDGLVERRHESIEVGLQRLQAAVRAGRAEEVCAAVMARVAARPPADDIAVLTLSLL